MLKMSKVFTIALISYFSSLGSTHVFSLENGSGNVQTSNHRIRSEINPITFQIEGQDYSFNFKRSNRPIISSNIPVYLAKSKPGSTPNYTYERVPKTEEIISEGFYCVDNAKKAVVYARYDENKRDIIYHGVFGESNNQHAIESMNGKNKLQRSRQQGNSEIYRVPRRNPRVFSNLKQERRSKRSYQYVDPEAKLPSPLVVLYPKLLILVDNRLFKYHNRDISKIIHYVATFWMAVDQKYLELEAPRVELSVTGIVIANDKEVFSYLEKGKLSEGYGRDRYGYLKYHTDYIYSNMTEYFQPYFSKDVSFNNYDTAVLMTAVDLNQAKGMTFRGIMCEYPRNNIIVGDEGWFDGVHTASHELAHALGAYHDGGAFQSSTCPAHDNTNGVSVMNNGLEWGDYYYWSSCTKEYIQEFATKNKAECLATPVEYF